MWEFEVCWIENFIGSKVCHTRNIKSFSKTTRQFIGRTRRQLQIRILNVEGSILRDNHNMLGNGSIKITIKLLLQFYYYCCYKLKQEYEVRGATVRI